MNTTKHIENTPFRTWFLVFLVITIAFPIGFSVQAKETARISAKRNIYDFGTVIEQGGLVSHMFSIYNTGTKPLVLTRVTASCGCTQPKWDKRPIAPGDSSNVIVSYNPQGRLGSFYKTVHIYSNGKEGAYLLGVKGEVVSKPAEPEMVYPYKIGTLKVHSQKVLFSTIRPDESLSETIYVFNDTPNPMTVKIGEHSDVFTVLAKPTFIGAGEKGEISVLLDAKKIEKKGRISVKIPISVKTKGRETEVEDIIVAANVIDDFSKLSASDRKKAAVCELSATLVDFGTVGNKKPLLSFLQGKGYRELLVTNKGKSPLMLYSISCDNEVVSVIGGKKEIKPGGTATYKIAINTKMIKTRMEALINVVCNDPTGPVRLIKVLANR